MSEGLGFLDSVVHVFRRRGAEKPPAAPPARVTDGPRAELESAIRALDRKIAEASQAAARSGGGDDVRASATDRVEAAKRRMEAAHRAIREDIDAMHARLGSGLAPGDVDRIAARLRELGALTAPGRDSHELLPRARYAVGGRLRREAGELAIARLVALLERHQMSWPDPTHHRPGDDAEEIARSRSRRLRDVRAAFLAHDFERAAECVVGVVRGWQSDYPDRGTPLWEETVLEAIAAAFRGELLDRFVAVLERDRERLLAQVEDSIGREVAALQGLITSGVTSIEQASQAVASSLRAMDELLPELAWQHVRAELPDASAARV
jgi:hypothetical protein